MTAVRVLLDFAWKQALSCLFAVALFAALAITSVVPLPIAQYDALLIFAIALTLGLWAAGWETGREVAVIAAFHLIGLALEIYKVRVGSWSYPGEGWAVVAGVPLYSGFMYAAVGSYICQAWRRLDFRVTHYHPVLVTTIALLLYANFYTHHFWPDARWLLALAMLIVLGATRIHFTAGGKRLRIPLSVGFILVGVALWVAENAGTFLGAWRYPNQAEVWELVHTGKVGSWALLVSLSFALIATVKAGEGRLYGTPGDVATVTLPQTSELPTRP